MFSHNNNDKKCLTFTSKIANILEKHKHFLPNVVKRYEKVYRMIIYDYYNTIDKIIIGALVQSQLVITIMQKAMVLFFPPDTTFLTC